MVCGLYRQPDGAYTCIDNVLHTLGVYDAEQEYTISNNGGVVTENKNYRKLSFHELPYEIAERLFAFGIEQDVVHTGFYSGGCVCVSSE